MHTRLCVCMIMRAAMLKVLCSLTVVSCDKGVHDFLENTPYHNEKQ